jgi:hypothetical protein
MIWEWLYLLLAALRTSSDDADLKAPTSSRVLAEGGT